jgi:CRISPR-associated protein Cas6
MYWEEDKKQDAYVVPDDVVDLSFSITCRALPVDHAYALAEAVRGVLPWLDEEQGAGVHPIHVAESGNGWMRPQGAEEMLYLSRRTKLVLRVPQHRLEDGKTLSGRSLEVAGQTLDVGAASVRLLSDITTVFSRYVVSPPGLDEEAFLAEAVAELKAMGIQPRKMLCGIEKTIATPEGELRTRSLMLADLSVEESVELQRQGLGTHRWLGCGLFIPHKDIKPIAKAPAAAQG